MISPQVAALYLIFGAGLAGIVYTGNDPYNKVVIFVLFTFLWPLVVTLATLYGVMIITSTVTIAFTHGFNSKE